MDDFFTVTVAVVVESGVDDCGAVENMMDKDADDM